ncbi:WD40-repeat-containing domain protein [Syncephalastrum racemosum]|uniref:WD40-repeat-containing domain protein n=1 Tax=Syncephalastrum racemosum TaxID=13706 RepID=A0A1X2HJK9_SYNRA|nr:WD40-repeat-containing domain protein [Syncephalastrum racemosum]
MVMETSAEYTLPGVLHFLQAEWRRFERERNEWAIERAELKSHIVLLEGERRGFENLKHDLLKRIKMLEYALKQESTVDSPNARKYQTIYQDYMKPESTAVQEFNTMTEKSRERSRNLLNSCLQEINTLTAMPTQFPLLHSLPYDPLKPASTDLMIHSKPVSSPSPPSASDTSSPASSPSLSNRSLKNGAAATNSKKTAKSPTGTGTIRASASRNSNKNRPFTDEASAPPQGRPPSPPSLDQARNEVPPNVDEVAMLNNAVGEEKPEDETEDESLLRSKRPGTYMTDFRCRHLDSVRSVGFHPTDLIVASGSDDGTVKVWDLSSSIGRDGNSVRKPGMEETMPQITYRGHTHPVSSVVVSGDQKRVYSASLDSTIRVWRLPSAGHTLYSPVDPSLKIATYVGHSDAVWDIELSPEGLLASASADGTVKIWNTESSGDLLKSSWGYDGVTPENEDRRYVAPTCLQFCPTDTSKVAVGYANATIRIYDVATGKLLTTLAGSDDQYDGTVRTQINTLVAHPTMPLIVSGHEDKQIKFFDLRSGSCTQSMSAHMDAVAALDIDPSGSTLVSGGHDGSIRLWDMNQAKTCIQEFSAHRKKADEGVMSVQYHERMPWMVSGGADGQVKVYHHGHH